MRVEQVAKCRGIRNLTLDDLVTELAERHGITIHRVSVWRLLRGIGLTHKKDLQAVEQKRPEVREAHQIWITRRQPFMRKPSNFQSGPAAEFTRPFPFIP